MPETPCNGESSISDAIEKVQRLCQVKHGSIFPVSNFGKCIFKKIIFFNGVLQIYYLLNPHRSPEGRYFYVDFADLETKSLRRESRLMPPSRGEARPASTPGSFQSLGLPLPHHLNETLITSPCLVLSLLPLVSPALLAAKALKQKGLCSCCGDSGPLLGRDYVCIYG